MVRGPSVCGPERSFPRRTLGPVTQMTRDELVKTLARCVVRNYLADVIANGPVDITQFTDDVMADVDDGHRITLMVDRAAIKLLAELLSKVHV